MIPVLQGNIWDFLDEESLITIPTNAGWNRGGYAVMGAGLARQAKQRYPGVDAKYGEHLRWSMDQEIRPPVCQIIGTPLLMFPTKPLNPKDPHLSWKNPSTIEYIEDGLPELRMFAENHRTLVPLLGAGHGGLSEDEVIPLLNQYLGGTKAVLVVQ